MPYGQHLQYLRRIYISMYRDDGSQRKNKDLKLEVNKDNAAITIYL